MMLSEPKPTQNSGETNDYEWTGRLYSDWNLNATYASACALEAEAIGDPKLSAWPKYLRLELIADSEISTLDIQSWIRQTKAPVVRLEHTNGTDRYYFDNLIETIRNARGYAIVKWEIRGRTLERLLIAPLGKALLCAAFPENGIPYRPTHQLPRPIRIRHRERPQIKEKSRRGSSSG